MEIENKKLLKIVGDKGRYQYIILITFILCWGMLNNIGKILNFLELKEKVTYYSKDEGKNITETIDDEICKLSKDKYTVTETYDFSLVIDLNIQCEKMKISLIGTICSVGYLFGALTFPYVLKLFGEKKTLILYNIVYFIPYIISLFYISYGYLLFFAFIAMSIVNSMEYVESTLIAEFVNPEVKSVFSAMMNCGSAFGGIFYVLLVYGLQNWKKVFICGLAAAVVILILIIIFIKNSFTYYIKKKDYEGYIKLLKFIAKINGKQEDLEKALKTEEIKSILKDIKEGKSSFKSTPKFELLETHENHPINESSHNHTNEKQQINDNNKVTNITQKEISLQILASPPLSGHNDPKSSDKIPLHKPKLEYNVITILRYKSTRGTFIIFCITWMLTSFLNSGAVIGLKKLKGSIYINSLLLYICEMPAYFITGFVMNIKYIGRKFSLIIMTAGFTLMNLLSYIFFNNDNVIIVCYLINRFFVMSCFCIYYTYCLESYPKSIAKLAYGINGAFNNLGGIIVPFIVEYINDRPRFLLFSICGFGCCLLMTLLDETIGKPIRDQIKEIDDQNSHAINLKQIVV